MKEIQELNDFMSLMGFMLPISSFRVQFLYFQTWGVIRLVPVSWCFIVFAIVFESKLRVDFYVFSDSEDIQLS